MSIPVNGFRLQFDSKYENQESLLKQSQKYIESYKKMYDSILSFIENPETNDDDFQDLIEIINIQLNENKQEELHFLYMIQYISNNHHRNESLFAKIFKIILYYSNQIKKTFSNIQIFDIFKKNKIILLFLFDNRIIDIDENIFQLIYNTFEKNGNCYSYFFYPEIKNFLDEKSKKDIEDSFLAKDDNIFENFEQNRHKGENHSYICSLIRQDSVEEFVAYVNRNNISLNSTIVHSIFETNPFLIKKSNISLIEYATFFGSIQIYQYLYLNNVEIPFNLLKFAIHSKNADLFHLIEYNTKFNEISCYNESIKCHHNDMTEYIKNNFYNSIQIEKDFQSNNTVSFFLKYRNFSNFPNFPNYETDDDFFYLSKYGYNILANISLIQKVKYLKNTFIKNDKIVSLRADSKFKVLIFYYFMLNKYEFQRIDHRNNCVIDKIVIPPSITYIKDECFDKYVSLTQITIPSSVTLIGENSFRECSSLKQIAFAIPSSVFSIGEYAFDGCSSLEQITIPLSVTEIGNDAFCNCKSLAQITILSFLTSFNFSVFYNCRSLTQIFIPSSVICIKNNAFCYCFSLTKILFANQSSLELIGKNAFHKCTSLKNISFPSSVKVIENFAFSDCKSLTLISIPSAKKIGNYAFKRCSSLIQIKIPSSITEIGENAFEGCSSLEQIKVPSSATEIGNQASEE